MNTLSGFGEPRFGTRVQPLLYAQEPEEEADYDELPETQGDRPARGSTVRRSVPPKQKKPSSGRPLILLLLIVLIAGVAYVVMTPGAMPPFIAELLGVGSPETPGMPPAGGAAKLPPPGQPQTPHLPTTPAPATPPPAEPAHDLASSPPAASSPAAPTAPVPGMAASSTPASPVPTPAYGEGQMVFVALDPTLPVGMMVLSGDAVGSKPGPSVRPGAQVTVLDAEYTPNGWIYSIRTPEGAIGWISEKRLKVGR